MERKLLLLGLLKGSDMYGYQLNEIIDMHMSTSVHLTRPTAYRLLGQMADDGWVTFHEEQKGNRPTRRVFTITPKGERAFQEDLRACLANFSPAEYQSTICMAFLDEIDVEEALPLLELRKGKIEKLYETTVGDESHQMGSMQFVINNYKRHLQTELEWLQDVINQLKEN